MRPDRGEARARLGLLGLVAALGACLADPPPPVQPECTRDVDCGAGKKCIDTQCFAATPGGLQFSAEVFAPANKPDMLARAEIKDLQIDQDTMKVNLMFARSIRVEGRVVLHTNDTLSAAARVVFRRPSRIKGAPDYEVSVDSMPGKAYGEAAFSARLVPSEEDEKYLITIYPDDGTLFSIPPGQQAPNTLVPPVTTEPTALKVDTTSPLNLTCDSTGLRAMVGTVVDGQARPMAGMIVRAYSEPLVATTKPQLVSSTGMTDGDGRFTIYLPANRTSYFDLKVSASTKVQAPTLVRRQPTTTPGASVTQPIQLSIVAYPDYPKILQYAMPVSYADAAGVIKPAVGARVSFSTTLMVNDHDTVTYDVQGTVDPDGSVRVPLIPASKDTTRAYRLSVLPLQGTFGQSVWDNQLMIGPTSEAVLPAQRLATRVQVIGKLLDSTHAPVGNFTVRPQLSQAFTGPLSAEAGDRLAALSLPEATTDRMGAFSLFLDPTLLGQIALYDLDLVPPGGSVLPRWSQNGVNVATGSGTVDVGEIALPLAALASGQVTDENSAPVANAEVRVYAKAMGDDAAKLRTLAKSDNLGNIVLVLPSQ